MAASRIGRSLAMRCTSFGKVAVAGASSAISIRWSNRYRRTRLPAASRLRPASWIAYAELTNVTSGRLQSVSAGDTLETPRGGEQDVGVEECAVGRQCE